MNAIPEDKPEPKPQETSQPETSGEKPFRTYFKPRREPSQMLEPPRSSWAMMTQVVAVLALSCAALPWIGLIISLIAIGMSIYVIYSRPHLSQWAWLSISTAILALLAQILIGFGVVATLSFN